MFLRKTVEMGSYIFLIFSDDLLRISKMGNSNKKSVPCAAEKEEFSSICKLVEKNSVC